MNANDISLTKVDELGMLLAQIADLTKRADAIKDSLKDAATAGMGATVVAGQINENILSIAHVGDSRIYLFRGRQLQQLTQDHSLVMEQVRQGLIRMATQRDGSTRGGIIDQDLIERAAGHVLEFTG